MSSKYASKGTLLQREIASVFTTVAAVVSLDFPDGEVLFFDGTALDSGVDVEDGELAGHATPGGVNGELFYDPADVVHKLLPQDYTAGGSHVNWKVVMPDTASSVCSFEGSVRQFKPKAAAKEAFKADFGIKLRYLATYPGGGGGGGGS